MKEIKATTILGVRHKGKVAMAGDGQITFGDMSFKQKAVKVREFKHAQNKVLGGFAGAAADALTLFEKFEQKLEQYEGDLKRATVELAKDWRTDKYLQKLEAMLIVTDGDSLLVITGAGDVLEPEHNVAAIGSGGNYALAAARGMMNTKKSAEAVAREAMAIAADICVYTNGNLTIETL